MFTILRKAHKNIHLEMEAHLFVFFCSFSSQNIMSIVWDMQFSAMKKQCSVCTFKDAMKDVL